MSIKYPRTPHVSWSESLGSDDKMIPTMAAFIGKRVIVKEKVDGENCTMTPDICHARSCDSTHHWTRDWVKAFHATIKRDIPDGHRICGENLFAQHSIRYEALPSYFLGFSIWDERNVSLAWDVTAEWFDLLGIQHPAVIYDGVYNEIAIKAAYAAYTKTVGRDVEGYVIRVADEIPYSDFGLKVCKFVRSGHVQPGDSHWLYGGREIKQNALKMQETSV